MSAHDQITTASEAGSNAQLEQALARCARGERAALQEIFDLESGRMIAIAMRIVSRRDIAEEVVQDGFVRIWQHAGDFDPGRGAARAWMFTIIRNRAISVLRQESRLEPMGEFEGDQIADEADTPEIVMSKISDNQALKRCLELLPPERRGLILLAYIKGLSHGEIAGRLRMPLGTVKSWIRRSLLSLRECLA